MILFMNLVIPFDKCGLFHSIHWPNVTMAQIKICYPFYINSNISHLKIEELIAKNEKDKALVGMFWLKHPNSMAIQPHCLCLCPVLFA